MKSEKPRSKLTPFRDLLALVIVVAWTYGAWRSDSTRAVFADKADLSTASGRVLWTEVKKFRPKHQGAYYACIVSVEYRVSERIFRKDHLSVGDKRFSSAEEATDFCAKHASIGNAVTVYHLRSRPAVSALHESYFELGLGDILWVAGGPFVLILLLADLRKYVTGRQKGHTMETESGKGEAGT